MADPAGAAPKRVEAASPIQLPGVKRVKIRSGPYNVPNMGKKSLNGHMGMLESYPDNVSCVQTSAFSDSNSSMSENRQAL